MIILGIALYLTKSRNKEMNSFKEARMILLYRQLKGQNRKTNYLFHVDHKTLCDCRLMPMIFIFILLLSYLFIFYFILIIEIVVLKIK